MEQRALGNSDLAVTRIGLGTWAIGGGDWIGGWGPQHDAESIATITRAIDHGINWLDTASVYGLGHAEAIVARALKGISHGSRPYVFTACSLVWDELGNVAHNLRPASIRREAEGSLRRLGVDCLDLYQLAWPSWPKSPPDHDPGSLEEAWSTMASLQQEGKARFIGVANCDIDQLARLHSIAPVTSLQAPHSLTQRHIDLTTSQFCTMHGIGLIAHSSLQAGLLSGRMTSERVNALPHNDWRRRSPCFHDPCLHRTLTAVERLRAIGLRSLRTAGEVAIAWTLHSPALTAAVVGARHPYQVDEIAAAAHFRLSVNEMQEIEQACPECPSLRSH